MVSFRGLSTRILCEGQTLEEYSVSSESDNAIASCFVISEAGKAFSFEFKHEGEIEEDTIFLVHIDGHLANNRLVRKDRTETLKGAKISPSHNAPLFFSTVQVTDDESAAQSSRIPGEIGSIEIRIYRVKIGPIIETGKFTADLRDKLSDKPIHETSKKVGSHQVTLGVGIPHAMRTFSTEYIDSKQPLVTIKYLYRPREILQAEGILPSSPIRPSKRTLDAAEISSDEGPSERSKKQCSAIKVEVKSEPLDNQEKKVGIAAEVITIHDSDSESQADSDVEFETMKETMELLQKRMAAIEKRRKSRKGKGQEKA
ncbi:hypothetical protein QCA50_006837 [Cerrena zonata]|uniref:DUF7918 domain-containing protein n=1 Tax=Cerrena zonata TaxID=2478898 RepID=A0AAW0GA10_9APHY